MILRLKKNTSAEKAEELALLNKAFLVKDDSGYLLVTSFTNSNYHSNTEEFLEQQFQFTDDIQLASKKFSSSKRKITIDDFIIGGEASTTILIAGPCSVESKEQIELSATFLQKEGIKILRAGCFKPRTSPYSFQGLGEKGLALLIEIREKFGLKIITEIKDSTHAQTVIDHTDIIQVGAKAMYDQSILKMCSKANKPVLLKRGFGSTLQEFVQSAEFILSGGNNQVILCERGIRTFETKTRFTLDLCGVAYLKEYCNLPIVVDPSHAMGYQYGVPDLSRAAMAMGVDGLLLEVHPNPTEALSDASQQLNHDQFSSLLKSLHPIAKAVNKKLI